MSTIADVQAFWDARPCNIRHSNHPVGTVEFFDEVDRRRELVEPHNSRFADYQRWANLRVLEVGCGIGTDLARFAAAGADVTAVDLSPYSCELARLRLEQAGLKGQVVNGDAEHLDSLFPGETFDLVYSFGVIHHSPNPAAVVAAMRAVSHPDTVLKAMLYATWSWKTAKLTGGRVWRDDLVARQSEAQTGCPVTYTYTRREARQLLADNGWTASSITKTFLFPYRIPDYTRGELAKTWAARTLPASWWRHLERVAGWNLLVEGVAA